MRKYIDGEPYVPVVSSYKEKEHSYVYDFEREMPYDNGGPVDELVSFIIAKYFHNDALGLKSLKKSGFIQTQTLNGRGYFHLKLRKDIPRWIVQSIFNDINRSGLIWIDLSTEKYPRTPRRPTCEDCIEGERIEKILESVRGYVLLSGAVIRPNISPYMEQYDEEQIGIRERKKEQRRDPMGYAVKYFPGGPCSESGDF